MSIQESGFRIQNGPAGCRPGDLTRRNRARSVTGPTATHRRAFTLIEVLAAMAVLVILVLALTRMFVEATGITRRGTTMLMRNSTMETAMETLLQDAEGMVVNERLGCYVEANVTDAGADGFGFDDVWFISTSGDQDDDMAYEYFHYHVSEKIATNQFGLPYKRFRLIKDRIIMALADDGRPPTTGNGPGGRFYALEPAYAQWWNWGKNLVDKWDSQVLADNVVRFDIYCLGWDGKGWMSQSGGQHVFDSTVGPNITGGNKFIGVPPAAFDIYLQITDPKVAEESGQALVAGVDATTQRKAREKMIRDSASLFGRVVPITGSAQYNRAVNYGTTNTAYYEN